jgi:predicted amidophosphoribosyltransferase
MLRELFVAGLDLVLPQECPGCDTPAPGGLCRSCAQQWRPQPFETRPSPVPEGLPICVAGCVYEGVARALILAYKERGRRGLQSRLGDAIALAVAAGAGGRPELAPLVLVPVPGTAASVRARHGDHMLRIAEKAARRLRKDGWHVVIERPLRALPKADSAHLDRQARAEAAIGAFALRPRRIAGLRVRARDATVVIVDDVLTTGATIAAVARRLYEAGAPAAFAVTVAATRLRTDLKMGVTDWQPGVSLNCLRAARTGPGGRR